MRKFYFKAKRLDTGRWITGNLVYLGMGIREVHIVRRSDGFHVQVDPKTICQYIGLKDKNGRMVFEGDYLRGFQYPYKYGDEYNYYAEVVWFDNSPAFGLCIHKIPGANITGISEGVTTFIEDWNAGDWEIIGNKFDNERDVKI